MIDYSPTVEICKRATRGDLGNHGYYMMNKEYPIDGERLIHRIVYKEFYKVPIKGFIIRHRCNNKSMF